VIIMTSSLKEFNPDWVSCPGETIVDLLEEFKWTQVELAERLGYTKKHIYLLLQGKAPITEETALRLEKTVGGTVQFWMNREMRYREAIARKKDIKDLKEGCYWLKELPIEFMLEKGLIKEQNNKVRQVYECLCFFGVSSVDAWKKKYESNIVAYRRLKNAEGKIGSIATWLRVCEKKAETVVCAEFSKKKFVEALEAIRKFNPLDDFKSAIPDLQRLCADNGIIFVTEEMPPDCHILGAAKWLDHNTGLVMLADDYETKYEFWFSFFHEVGHLLLHSKRLLYIDSVVGKEDDHEDEANQFAKDFLT